MRLGWTWTLRRKRAFTLIELLVVISIIALLLSILMPSLSKARKMAQSIQCAAKQKTFALTTNIYINDFKGSFPIAWMPPPKFGKAYDNTHPKVLLPYGLKPSEGAYYCPSDKPEPADSCKPYQIGTTGIQGKYSYQYNARFGGWGWPGYYGLSEFRPRKITELKRASYTVLLAEDVVLANTIWFERPWYFTYFHNGFMNIVLADCHIEKVKEADLYAPRFDWLLNNR